MLASTYSCTTTNSKEANAAEEEVNASEVVVNNIMARRSIRKYKNDSVPRDILDKIIECGINAPNGKNEQNYEVKVVCDTASTAFLSEQLNGLYKAPVYLFIAAKSDYDMSLIDVGLLSENICLSACAYGIGTINLGMPVRSLKEKADILAKLGFSEGYDICLILALGYADESPEAKPRKADKVQFVSIK
ncbi:MAG: nitroreductase [Bacteroidaceae bacterium]|nr:nitroreductase [Bacteroidaceae bacterium]